MTRAAAFGVFVELLPGVEGLCHRSELATESGRRNEAITDASKRGAIKAAVEEPVLPIGQECDFRIIKMNEAQKRIGLSLRAVAEEDERSRLQDYKRQAAAASSTVGDAMKQHKAQDREF